MFSNRTRVLIACGLALAGATFFLAPDSLELNTPEPPPEGWQSINAKLVGCLARRAEWPVSDWQPDAGNHRYAFRVKARAASERQYWAVVLPNQAGVYLLEVDGPAGHLVSYGPLSHDSPC